MTIMHVIVNNETARQIYVQRITDDAPAITFFDKEQKSAQMSTIAPGNSLAFDHFECDEIRITNDMDVTTYITAYPFVNYEDSYTNEPNAIVLILRESRNFMSSNILDVLSPYRCFNSGDSVIFAPKVVYTDCRRLY